MIYSAASAQSDKDWLETALEKTLRLSSPWELPLGPETDPHSLPSAFVIGPVEPAVVPEVPWGRKLPRDSSAKAPAGPVTEEHARLEVRLVDDFEDPWPDRDAAKASTNYESDPELIDPWEDSQGRP